MTDPRSLVTAAVRRSRRVRASWGRAARAASPRREWRALAPSGDAEAWWARESARVADAVDAVVPSVDEPTSPIVTVVCVTNRPAQAEHVCATILRQAGVGPLRVVIVLNDAEGDTAVFEERLAGLDLSVVHRPPPVSLGACLNTGWALAATRYVAKIDDDDTYGPHYLRDAVRVLRWSPAAVVGKHTYLARLHATSTTVLRFPGREWAYSGFVAGGTIVADTERTAGAVFGDSTTGEDSAFLAAVERSGGLILATSALDFVQARHAGNTWQFDDEAFSRGAVVLGPVDLAPVVAAGMAPRGGAAI